MNIEIKPGEEVSISRSHNGKILIVQRDDGTTLLTTNDRVRMEVYDSDGSLWKSPMDATYDRAGFWAGE